jgi:hypothetical protein
MSAAALTLLALYNGDAGLRLQGCQSPHPLLVALRGAIPDHSLKASDACETDDNGYIPCQSTREMPLAQHDDMIEQVSAYTASESLDVEILPRTPRRDQHFLDPHVADPAPKRRSIDAIAVRKRYRDASSHGNASTTCCAVHPAVGCSGTVKWTTASGDGRAVYRARFDAAARSFPGTAMLVTGTVRK